MNYAGGAIAVKAADDDVARLDADELCDRYADRVYRFAAMLCSKPADAEDLAHDAMIRAIRGLPAMDPTRGSVQGWLWRIVVNAARDAGRAERRRIRLMTRIKERFVPEEEASVDIADAIGDERLLEAIRRLAPRHRTLIALRFGADLDYAAIGTALEISALAARLATRRALLSLKQDLEQAR
jgi:RNA polymerase sigma-70 factor (ECF subfamily)